MNDAVPFSKGSVQGFLHSADEPVRGSLVLTHGAGSNCEAPLLVSIAGAFAKAGIAVLRIDLAFRQKRRFGPPAPAASAMDRAGLKDAIATMREAKPGHVFVGGHSYGGRQASMLASEEPRAADALLLLSYPLHPPEKPAQLRTAHFASLQTPALFVHGTKDPFGTPDEMRVAVASIEAPKRLVLVEGAGHDLARGKFDIESLVVRSFFELVG